jgi:hypothetical protein
MLLGIDGTVAAPRVREERGGDAGAFGLSSATDAQASQSGLWSKLAKGVSSL